MYIKNTRGRGELSVPENYGGNAFKNNVYTDIVPQEDDPSPQPASPSEPPRTDIGSARAVTQKISPSLPIRLAGDGENIGADPSELGQTRRPQQGSIFSSLLPSITSSHHFPFGHGIGSEELFILGIMLLIYMSGNSTDEIDSELLLLLCILLFSG